jgi:DNA polymerase
MSQPESALDLVYNALREMREQGVELRASSEALERLAGTRGAVSAVPVKADAPPLKAEHPTPNIAPAAPRASREASAQRPTSNVSVAVTQVVAEVAPELVVQGALAPTAGSKAERLAAMRGPVLACVKCPHLVKSRTQVVFGVGNPEAELMFVGEAPGEDEDKQGEPFVGKAGQLLTKIIETMGFARSDVYIANVLKCRPDMPPGMPGNRKPKLEEMQTCLPYLKEQISIIEPKVLVALGATAMEGLMGATDSMSRLRGRWHDFQGTPLMATYHPAYLLRNQALSEKRKVWEDMLMVLERMGKPITEKQRNYFLSK